MLTFLLSRTSKLKTVHLQGFWSKTVHLQGFWPKTVYLKFFEIQLKTLYLQGPCSSRPCISRPCCTSGHFLVNYVNIFHKTEVQTAILRCLAGLNFTPVTCTSLISNLTRKTIETVKWLFYNHF